MTEYTRQRYRERKQAWGGQTETVTESINNSKKKKEKKKKINNGYHICRLV